MVSDPYEKEEKLTQDLYWPGKTPNGEDRTVQVLFVWTV